MVSFEKRMKENIKNYAIENLFPIDVLEEEFGSIAEEYGVEVLLTERHGEKAVMLGDFAGFEPDVVNEPGEKLRICDRTLGHLYTRYDKVAKERRDTAKKKLNMTLELLATVGTEKFLKQESVSFVKELEKQLKETQAENQYGIRDDALTGVYSRSYFESRMSVLNRSKTVPIAVITVTISDWRSVMDTIGEERCISLMQLAASILMKQAKPEYILGRIREDTFAVLIPFVEEGEAESYMKRIQAECLLYGGYDDDTPFLRTEAAFKTREEENLSDLISAK